MAYGFTALERQALNAKAQAVLDSCPDVGSFLRRGLTLDPDHAALVYLRTAADPDPVITSGGEMLGLMRAARRWLRRNGISPDDVVALLAPNSTATSVVYWASMSFAALQPLNLLFTREAIAAQINAVKAKLLFVPPPGSPGGLFEKAEGLLELAPSLERIVVLPLDGSVALDGEVLAPDDNGDNDEDPRDPGAVAALLPTGGTTAAPKVVPLTHRNVVAGALGSLFAAQIDASDRMFVALPMFHVGGAFCSSLPALASGGTIVIPTAGGFRNPEVVANVWRIIEAQRITYYGGVPTAIGATAGVPLDGADISSLRQVMTGGSVCPPEIERRFLGLWPGDHVRKLYGMTEFAGAITQTPVDRDERPGSVGPPAALAEVAVLAGGVLHTEGPTPTGEILARGTQMFSGYVDKRQSGATFHEGWLRSGDLGRIGEDGEVYVTGRAKDIIIRGGHNIDPAMIEDIALRYPGIGLAAAVGRPDAYAGETPALFVTPAPSSNIDRDAFADFLQAGVVEPPARPRTIVFIDEMPVTPVGKIFKPRLRELAAETAARDALGLALPGIAFEVEARHGDGGLRLKAKVPAAWVEAARAELGKLPLGFEVEAG